MIFVLAALPLLFQSAPKIWDDAAMSQLELPLAKTKWSIHPATAETYYKLPVVKVFKSYPVYRPDHEPAGYVGLLQAQQPESAWDVTNLKTDADWIRAGELLFDTPTRIGRIAYTPPPEHEDPNYLHEKSWWERVKPPISFEAALPAYRYVIRRKGVIEVGWNACSMCHSRIMPSGIVEMGPPSQFPFDAAFAEDIRKSGRDDKSVARNRLLLRSLYFVPWNPQVLDKLAGFDHQQMALLLDGHPAGTMAIDRTTLSSPVNIPDLIGVGSRKYLDATGLHRQRNVEDLMRYIATHFTGDHLAAFGDWNADEGLNGYERFDDDQLRALAMYITALKPIKNPNKTNSFTKKGKAVFEREGCPACHPAPLYTNNMLAPAPGFIVPSSHKTLYEIMPDSAGTDPELALDTRRGTGYYRVPALTGLWYRGPFGHNGSVAELEQWLDSSRLRKDYFQNGFGGLSGRQGPVKGHEYGLHLNDQDRAALLAFLRTL